MLNASRHETTSDRVWSYAALARINERYHELRLRRMFRLDRVARLLSLAASSVAVISAVTALGGRSAVVAVTSLAALASLAALVFGFDAAARVSVDLRQRYAEHAMRLEALYLSRDDDRQAREFPGEMERWLATQQAESRTEGHRNDAMFGQATDDIERAMGAPPGKPAATSTAA